MLTIGESRRKGIWGFIIPFFPLNFWVTVAFGWSCSLSDLSKKYVQLFLFKPETKSTLSQVMPHFLFCLQKLPKLSRNLKLRGYSTLIWFCCSWKVLDSNAHRRSVMVTALSTTVTWLQLQNSGGSLLCGWNPFWRQEEISSSPWSVSLKNPVSWNFGEQTMAIDSGNIIW